MTGGELVGEVLRRQGVRFLFTLCGGHISPILVAAKALGIRVVDVRHEVDAVFAADAVARLSGSPGVAAVTAGPGATNTITAVKNAQMAQSPVVLLGGATGTILKGRGSLQDIDQMSLFEPHVKWAVSVARVSRIVPTLEKAFAIAAAGVPGPVFVELPIDLLYPEELIREQYGAKSGSDASGLGERFLQAYLRRHVDKLFRGADSVRFSAVEPPRIYPPNRGRLRRAAALLAAAERPLLMIGSQATLEAAEIGELSRAVERLGTPVYLSGMARGLLGRGHRLQLRHKRRNALKQADVVLLAGVPADFRLDYGRQISARAKVLSVNRCSKDLHLNRRPDLPVLGDPGRFLRALADLVEVDRPDWLATLRGHDDEREAEIDELAARPTEHINPLALCRAVDGHLADDSVLVADGGDFVATASYTTSPRGPLSWLDPGAFGTLGVGAGFALGAKLCRPEAEVWVIYGDGSVAYSVAEFDTFVRHGIPVIALVGNDAAWAQIAREQVEILDDDVGTVLRRTAYDEVAAGYGGVGLTVDAIDQVPQALAEAKRQAADGRPVLINAMIGATDFRKGSISM